MTVIMTAVCVVLGFPVALTISRASGRSRRCSWSLSSCRTGSASWFARTPGSNCCHRLAWSPSSPRSWASSRRARQLGYSTFAIGVGMVAGYLPLMILPMFMALDRIDPALQEAAADMGLSRRRTFWKVTVKLAMPGSIAGVLLVGIPATGEYTIPAILGGSKTLMVGNVEAEQFLNDRQLPVRRRHRHDPDGRHARRALRVAQAPRPIWGTSHEAAHQSRQRLSPSSFSRFSTCPSAW